MKCKCECAYSSGIISNGVVRTIMYGTSYSAANAMTRKNRHSAVLQKVVMAGSRSKISP